MKTKALALALLAAASFAAGPALSHHSFAAVYDADQEVTIEGKVGNFDLTYSGNYLNRDMDGSGDYSDYSYFYDAISGYGAYFYDNDGDYVSPNQYIQGTDRYKKYFQEFRISSPSDKRLRVMAGLFWQRQSHNIEQNYIIDDIADSITVTGTPTEPKKHANSQPITPPPRPSVSPPAPRRVRAGAETPRTGASGPSTPARAGSGCRFIRCWLPPGWPPQAGVSIPPPGGWKSMA